MNEFIDVWPKKIKPFDLWLEFKLQKLENNVHKKIISISRIKCRYCRREFEENVIEKTRDHIVPLSKGGLDNKENRTPCCFECNQWKDDKYLSDWFKEIQQLVRKKKERKPYTYNQLCGMLSNIKNVINYTKENNSKISIYKIP